MTIDRRDFIVGSALAAGVAVLPSVTGNTAQAKNPSKATGQTPGYYRTKVGALIVTAILDGTMEMTYDLFTGAKTAMLDQAKEKFFLDPAGPFPAYVNTYHIQAGEKSILIDTGAQGMKPTLGRTKTMLDLVAGGADHVDEVILTHMHPDHINGLLNPDGGIAFKNAVVKISVPEIDHWYDEARVPTHKGMKDMFDLAQENLGPYKKSGQLQTFKLDADLGNGLSSVGLPGHTPGHSGVMASDGREQLLIWADIVHNAFLQFDHPEQTLSFDTDEDAARATRLRLFDRVANEKLRIGGMHLPFNALGHVAKRGQGYEFVPQRWEADL